MGHLSRGSGIIRYFKEPSENKMERRATPIFRSSYCQIAQGERSSVFLISFLASPIWVRGSLLLERPPVTPGEGGL